MIKSPYELSVEQLNEQLESMVDIVFSNLSSEFLVLPKGNGFIEYENFRDAFEVLKRHTKSFENFSSVPIYNALLENSLVFCVLRSILGLTPPKWGELVRAEGFNIDQNSVRTLDRSCRINNNYINEIHRNYLEKLQKNKESANKSIPLDRIKWLIDIAVKYITTGSQNSLEGAIHRLDKFDTKFALDSLKHATNENVPYPVLLYERFLGRPFASHRDAVSELVGEVMENAIENVLRASGISYRKTGRAEKIPGFGQAPDFCIPDEISPLVVIEAKITSDDGTARDKVARIKTLVKQRDDHVDGGKKFYQVIACIDGRGFRVRREDMRQLLTVVGGKVFTLSTIKDLIKYTNLSGLISK